MAQRHDATRANHTPDRVRRTARRKLLMWLVGGLLLVIILGALAVRFVVNPMTTPVARGLTEDGYLHQCPSSLNCVSSTSIAPGAFIEPLTLPEGASLDTILAALPEIDRHYVEQSNDQYVHAVFITRLLGYRDDIEFARHPEDENRIQVRGESRLGQSDMGANRQRIEDLRALLSGQ